jgi:hypothetical protein
LRPLLDAALRLEWNDESYSWHGWDKAQIQKFLDSLPASCSLVAGIWETFPDGEQAVERLVVGFLCEVREGIIRTIRTFDSLVEAGLKPVDQLEPGIEDALEIMRLARRLTSPVAWALFIEKAAWDAWLFAADKHGGVVDKGEVLAQYAHQGKCVLLGSQAAHQQF